MDTIPANWTARVLVLAMVLMLAPLQPVTASDLVVRIEALRSASGKVRLALYDDAGRFLQKGAAHGGAEVPPVETGTQVVFSGLAPGTYAIAAYHDENDNGDFDTGFLGLPLEGFGFSNDAPVLLGAPSFDEVAVDVPQAGTVITVRMRYWDGGRPTASLSNAKAIAE
ncbi:MAG: DUF2141 domain-containing protein [Rhodospirillales bacterium]|nr:DUF2141 domain-containing protein [Rhodospirillales bacterium]